MHQHHGGFAVTSRDHIAQEKNLNGAFTQTRKIQKQLLLARLSYPMPTQHACNRCCSAFEMSLFRAIGSCPACTRVFPVQF